MLLTLILAPYAFFGLNWVNPNGSRGHMHCSDGNFSQILKIRVYYVPGFEINGIGTTLMSIRDNTSACLVAAAQLWYFGLTNELFRVETGGQSQSRRLETQNFIIAPAEQSCNKDVGGHHQLFTILGLDQVSSCPPQTNWLPSTM